MLPRAIEVRNDQAISLCPNLPTFAQNILNLILNGNHSLDAPRRNFVPNYRVPNIGKGVRDSLSEVSGGFSSLLHNNWH
jgi:hypothetical protein